MSDTISAADAEFYLSAVGLFPAPQRMEGFMTDRAWMNEAVDAGEFVLGVDGKLSAGWVPTLKKQTVSIMPDSASNVFFETLYQVETLQKKKIELAGILILPAINRQYVLIKGYLQNYTPIPGGARVLEGRPFGLIWQTITVAPKV